MNNDNKLNQKIWERLTPPEQQALTESYARELGESVARAREKQEQENKNHSFVSI